ncbi:MAG TPA: retropepsin-like aspartic protease [Tenuifilaceae bacterium]|nr:retropepsin-like aspartic protease [Tenuifilaceae bacterium]
MLKLNTIPLQVINIEPGGIHLVVDVYLDKKKLKFVLDTGASQSLIDKGLGYESMAIDNEKTEAIGFNSEKTEITFAAFKQVKIGKITFPSFKAAVADMTNLKDVYKEYAGFEINGLLGCDFIVEYFNSINIRQRKIFVNISKLNTKALNTTNTK